VLKAASARNITISIDLNYRAKLWQYGKQPVDIIPQLAQYCDLIMGNIWAAEKMLGINLPEHIHEVQEKNAYLEQAKVTSESILKQYSKCKWVANTFRFDYEKGIRYYTTLYTGQSLIVSKEYISANILDKVGSGDCFMAGLIYGLYQEKDAEETLNFATAAAFNKLFIPSDCTTATVAEIEKTRLANEN
jgi:2-dehydro-3-deoxygluconokinase